MLEKEKIEITIDEEDASENFGEDTFQENIIRFVEEGYKITYEEIKEADFFRDQSKMKITTHTLKTTARYMSSENFAQICQGIEHETKAPNWDKIIELLPDFYEYYEILYEKALKIYNRIKDKDQDDSGPLENMKENMTFWDRDQAQKKDKEKNQNVLQENSKRIEDINKNFIDQRQTNSTYEKINLENSISLNNSINKSPDKKIIPQFNFVPNFPITEGNFSNLIEEKNDNSISNLNKDLFNRNVEIFENNPLKNSFYRGKDENLFNSNKEIDSREKIIFHKLETNQKGLLTNKDLDDSFFDNKIELNSNEIKHLEENLKDQNITHDEILNLANKTLNLQSISEVTNTSMKSIRNLRELDKQASNIYFKNNINYGDDKMTNSDFKSNHLYL